MNERAVPVLPALDLARSLEFYRRLGFEARTYEEYGYAVLVREGVEIHLWTTDDRHVAENSGCYVRVADVDAWRAAFVAAGAEATPVEVKPWEMREFAAHDPSGNLLRVASCAWPSPAP